MGLVEEELRRAGEADHVAARRPEDAEPHCQAQPRRFRARARAKTALGNAWYCPAMFRRTRAPTDPVTVHLDGEAIPAERGEPLAAALLGSDKTILARSPKLHRPRGPSCFRGGCDGCLARVDGVPNVMTCLAPARGGEHVDSQNVVGSRKADLLRVTDWFFAQGLDHHHLMAGVPGLQSVMQGVATKIAGLGRLPGAPVARRPARRVEADVVVTGGGVTGIAVASRLGRDGLRVVLVDDGLALGGALSARAGARRGAPGGGAARRVDVMGAQRGRWRLRR